MHRRFLCGFCAIILSSILTYSQGSTPASVFIAGNVGTFVSTVAGFEKIYNSRLAFAFGGTIGIPVSSRLYLYAKFTTCAKSGVPVSRTSYYLNGQHFTTPQTVTGTMSMRQWLINLGLLRNISTSSEVSFETQAGLTYSRFSWGSESVAPGNWVPDSPVKNHEMAGLFVGITLEHKFTNSRISVFIDAQYNHLWSFGSPYVSTYGAVNVSTGIRLYTSS